VRQASSKEISNEGGRLTTVFSLFNMYSHHGYQLDRKKMQLRLNTVCGSHSRAGLSITQRSDMPGILNMYDCSN